MVNTIPPTPLYSYTDNYAFQSTPTCDYTGTGLTTNPLPCNGALEQPTSAGTFSLAIAGTIVQIVPFSVIGAQSDTISFEYDPTVPTVSIDSPAVNGVELALKRPPIGFSAADDPTDLIGGLTVTCSLDAGPAIPCGPSPFIPGGDLAEGSHTLAITATDGANTAFASRSFIVDTVAPEVSVLFPTPGATVDSSVPEVNLSIAGLSTIGGGAFCRYDEQPYQQCSASWTGGSLADGAHRLWVKVSDAAGNERVVFVDFFVDDALGATPVPYETSITGGRGGKVKRGKFKVKAGFSLLGPEGSNATVLCAAKVKATIKPKGGRTYTDRIQFLNKNGRCVASASFTLPKRFKGKRAKLTFRYPGTSTLGPVSRSKTIKKL